MSRKVDTSILLDGRKVQDPVLHLALEQYMHRHHVFSVRFRLKDARPSTFKEAAERYLGRSITLRVNFAPESPDSRDLVFEGVVTATSLARAQGGNPEMVVNGHSATVMLEDGQRVRSFTDRTLDQIVRETCAALERKSIAMDVAPANGDRLPFTVQYEESSFHFLGRLAARYGEWFYFDGERLHFGKPKGGGQDERLEFGANLFNFDLGLRTVQRGLSAAHYAYLKPELLSANESERKAGVDSSTYGQLTVGPGGEVFPDRSQTMIGQATDGADVRQRVFARHAAQAAGQVVLSGTSDNTRLSVGRTVKVSGPGGDGNASSTVDYGRFIITQVLHETGHGDYWNSFEAIPVENDMVPVIAGLHQPVSDPQVAVVKEVDDPEGLGRVKVQFLWQRGSAELSPWIRVVSLHAMAESGAQFVPEVGEEVLVDFEFNDPEQPFVLGSFYNGEARPDKDWVTARNEVKVLRTRSGNEVVLIDKAGKESIQVRNRDGRNELTMDLGGTPSITLRSEGKLTLDAPTIELKCDKLDVQASAAGVLKSNDLKIEGSAMVTVKGGLIKLN